MIARITEADVKKATAKMEKQVQVARASAIGRKPEQLIIEALQQASDEISAKLVQLEGRGKTGYGVERLEKLKGEIDKATGKLARAIDKGTRKGMGQTFDAGFEAQQMTVQEFVDAVYSVPVAAIPTGTATYAKLQADALASLFGMAADGLTLSDRTTRYGRGVRDEIMKAIVQGVAQGKGAAPLARDIQALMNQFPNGRGVYKNPYKNALRITRTEMSRAFSSGQQAYNTRKPWITGDVWKLSPAHSAYDICDIHATADIFGMGPGVYAKGAVPDQPAHPHCMCFITSFIDMDRLFTPKDELKPFTPPKGDDYTDDPNKVLQRNLKTLGKEKAARKSKKAAA